MELGKCRKRNKLRPTWGFLLCWLKNISARNVTFIITLAIAYSCNQVDNNHEKNNNPVNSTLGVDTSSTVRRDSIPIKTLNYDNWEMFWTAFTTATLKKDTAIIIQLTNFPFLQNTSLADKNEFLELWISQTYEIRISDTPVLSTEFSLQLGEHERANLPKFDSIRYTCKNHKDFYFAKVSGYYRLIEIITPG